MAEAATEVWNQPIWEETRNFGYGVRRYRCMDLVLGSLGQSTFEYFNERLNCWRRVNNYDVREAMHVFTVTNFRDPF